MCLFQIDVQYFGKMDNLGNFKQRYVSLLSEQSGKTEQYSVECFIMVEDTKDTVLPGETIVRNFLTSDQVTKEIIY